MASTTEAKNKLAQQQNRPQQKGQTVTDLVEQMRPAIERALPKAMSADRFARIVLTTLRTNPTLAQCNPQSLLAAVMLSSQLGLEPGPLGHAYFVPFNTKGGKEVTFIIGYRGMLDLARRSGEIASIEAREVCANDEFEYEFGLDPKLKHRPASGERGEPTHYYGIAKMKDGGYYFEVLSKDDVDSYKRRSRASDNGPWVTDYSAMARKTVIRRMAPYLPLAAEAARAIASDEGVVARLDELGDDETDVQVTHDEPIDVRQVEQDDVTDAEEVEPDPEPEGEPIGQLRKPQLVKRLHEAGLDTDGKVDELRERYREYVEGSSGSPPEDTQDQDRDEAGEPDPPEGEGSPESAEEEEGDPAPPSDPSSSSVPPHVNPETGEPWTWKDHAEARGLKTLDVLKALKDHLPDGVAQPVRGDGIAHLEGQNDELRDLIHERIEAVAK